MKNHHLKLCTELCIYIYRVNIIFLENLQEIDSKDQKNFLTNQKLMLKNSFEALKFIAIGNLP